MAQSIHPATQTVHVLCGGCNNKFDVVSSYQSEELRIELCYNCHPAYTGKRKISKAGKIDRFAARYEKRSTDLMTKTGTEADSSQKKPE